MERALARMLPHRIPIPNSIAVTHRPGTHPASNPKIPNRLIPRFFHLPIINPTWRILVP